MRFKDFIEDSIGAFSFTVSPHYDSGLNRGSAIYKPPTDYDTYSNLSRRTPQTDKIDKMFGKPPKSKNKKKQTILK